MGVYCLAGYGRSDKEANVHSTRLQGHKHVTSPCFFHTLPFDDLLWKRELENKT
jgi:hypothetical protein